MSPHKLAVLYLIFALGTLVDLTLPPCLCDLLPQCTVAQLCPTDSKDAEKYRHLSRACLSLRSVFDSPELATVQTIILMASYHGTAGKRYTMDSAVSEIYLSYQSSIDIAGDSGLSLHLAQK